MRFVPKALLRTLYNRASLKTTERGVYFSIKNRLSPTRLEQVNAVVVNGQAIALNRVMLVIDHQHRHRADQISAEQPLDFALATLVSFEIDMAPLSDQQTHHIDLHFRASPFGDLKFDFNDELATGARHPDAIPRDAEDDYSAAVIGQRRDFIEQKTGATLHHVSQFSFPPDDTRGNIEHLLGAAQVPIGIAGPLLIHGDHAEGEFYVPLATTEGTLVASYNRGMKVIQASGGARCTVVGDAMQRAPVFVFANASQARQFADWLTEHTAEIRAECEASDPFVKLKYIDHYLVSRFCYTRFNFTTGDAAGMNMVGKATFAACNWILERYPADQIETFFLESNLATDKKASLINTMRSRGKRVTAEVTIPRQVLQDLMEADTVQLHQHAGIANIGSILAGANNNGCHAANAITAMFIATGQDVANVAESSAGILHSELTDDKDLYLSITLPSLIIATRGGGTGLATQSECLRMLGCEGSGTVMKLAEIMAGTVLAGEISLAAAISSLDWVSSHDQYGRNDPTQK